MSRRRSPFLPYLAAWMLFVAAAFWAVRAYAPPLADVWRLLAALNAATFLLFGLDKLAARAGVSRAPELLLYLTALLGGSAGAVLGMLLFRHKTSKTPFLFIIAAVVLAQAALVWLLWGRR